MLLFLQIMLTASAWKKGWSILAVAPLGIGIMIARSLASHATSVEAFKEKAILIDIAICVVLGIMSAVPLKKDQAVKPQAPVTH